MASPCCPLPARTAVRDLLADLLGCKVTVTDGEPQQLDPERPAPLAVYRFDDRRVAALWVAELHLACRTAAAIASLPAADAEAARREGAIDGDLGEFYRESVNVLSRLLNTPATPHVVLDDLHAVPGRVPGDVAELAGAPGARLDYAVELEGYGGGAMTLLAQAGLRRCGTSHD